MKRQQDQMSKRSEWNFQCLRKKTEGGAKGQLDIFKPPFGQTALLPPNSEFPPNSELPSNSEIPPSQELGPGSPSFFHRSLDPTRSCCSCCAAGRPHASGKTALNMMRFFLGGIPNNPHSNSNPNGMLSGGVAN